MSLIRWQNLESSYHQRNQRTAGTADDTHTLPGSGAAIPQRASMPQASSNPETKISYESNTLFGKVTVTDISVGGVASSAKELFMNAMYAVQFDKSCQGITPFRYDDIPTISLVLMAEHWRNSPIGPLARLQPPPSAVSGSLTFTAPTACFDLLQQSSALKALMALVFIASTCGQNLERSVSMIAQLAVDACFARQPDIGRSAIVTFLERAMNSSARSMRSATAKASFDQFVGTPLKGLPDQLQKLCARTVEDVDTLGIEASQLAAVAHWAFASPHDRRVLMLRDPVEALAAAVVSSFFTSRYIAIVDCQSKTHRILDSDKARGLAPAFAFYHGGGAQEATTLFHTAGWLQPSATATINRTEVQEAAPSASLCCSVNAALRMCVPFLMRLGIDEREAASLLDAFKKDAMVQFARQVCLVEEQQIGYLQTSANNVAYWYEYGAFQAGYDWDYWLEYDSHHVEGVVRDEPSGHVYPLGSSTYHGYAAVCLKKTPKLSTSHGRWMANLPARTHARDSDVSNALATVAGLVYGLAMGCVHDHRPYYHHNSDSRELGCRLDTDLGCVYQHLHTEPRTQRKIARTVCLGVFAKLWLGLPALYIPQWPHTSLGVSNSRGAVMSATFGETTGLPTSTKKFVFSVDVPDLMTGDKPVLACAVTPQSTIQRRGRPIEDNEATATSQDPYDGCFQTHCIAITGNDVPTLGEKNLLNNRVSIIPVCGYIACGLRWWERVDLDSAFAVMAASDATAPTPCSSCSPKQKARWLQQELFLREPCTGEDSGTAFACSLPPEGGKLVLPAHRNGLMQSFLAATFRQSAREVGYALHGCIEHATGDVIIV
ncbi:hypothetical protein LTR82_011753 [Friedmanniomyces endolithicus]|uniref:Uncharacterized protein n=1 Tax=Friedmanniomyces endolithicus TaxID=329885 RepID=A0AAN6J5F2_9PEZI|nr:hypothetical protein LTR82_011753 [Friedmanniomyces endolithicus]